MQSIQTVLYWLAQSPIMVAACLFGGAAVAVLIYTYFVDYRMLTDQD